jgi:nicotinate-nucleotide adenylyltransferase
LRRRSSVKIAQKRVGIFAGSFDPIHDGHIAVANTVVEALELDKLEFIVETKPYGNKKPVDVELRRKMVNLAIENYSKLKQLSISQEKFTIAKSLPVIEKKFADYEIYFVLGADIFMSMNRSSWPNLEELLKHYIVVIERNNITENVISKHAVELGVVIAILPSEHESHSSTDVRMQPHKKSIWVPEAVADFIDEKKLYY